MCPLGLALPSRYTPLQLFLYLNSCMYSDLDLVICLPNVRRDTPAETPGDLEGRNAIKETWQQNLARKLSSEPWVDTKSLKTISVSNLYIHVFPSNISSSTPQFPS